MVSHPGHRCLGACWLKVLVLRIDQWRKKRTRVDSVEEQQGGFMTGLQALSTVASRLETKPNL